MLSLRNPFSASAEFPVAPVAVLGVWDLCRFQKVEAPRESMMRPMTGFAKECLSMAGLLALDDHVHSAT